MGSSDSCLGAVKVLMQFLKSRVITFFPVVDLEYLVWIKWLYASLAPSGPYISLCEALVKG